MSIKRLLTWGLALLLVLGVAACGEASDDAGTIEPDLEGIPDIVAVVEGDEISKADFIQTYELQFQQFAAQAQATGQPPDQDQLKKQTAESMVGARLLLQESVDRGFEASDKDVATELDSLVEQSGLGSAKELFAALEEQGTDEKTARKQLREQIKVDKLIAEEAGDVAPTDEEVKELYEQLTAQQEQTGGQALPPLDEIRSELEEQLKTQKESEVANTLVAELRKDAEVTINL